jgi:hypothetical protein
LAILKPLRAEKALGGNSVARAAKLAFTVSLLALNFYFVWASYFLRWLSPSLYISVNRVIRSQDIALFTDLHLYDHFYSSLTFYTQIVADFEALAFLLVLMASTLLLSRGRGPGFAILRTLQVAALCFVVFGLELALFDFREFYIHFTDAQLAYNIIPWFSNADMFLSALVVFGTTTLLSNPSWRRNSLAIIALALVVLTAVGAVAASQPPAGSTQSVTTTSPTQVSSIEDSYRGLGPSGNDPLASLLVAPLEIS